MDISANFESIKSAGKRSPKVTSETFLRLFFLYFFFHFMSNLYFERKKYANLRLLLLSLLLFNPTPEPRMYLDHEGNRKGDISPS